MNKKMICYFLVLLIFFSCSESEILDSRKKKDFVITIDSLGVKRYPIHNFINLSTKKELNNLKFDTIYMLNIYIDNINFADYEVVSFLEKNKPSNVLANVELMNSDKKSYKISVKKPSNFNNDIDYKINLGFKIDTSKINFFYKNVFIESNDTITKINKSNNLGYTTFRVM